jgi:hypothetical protein
MTINAASITKSSFNATIINGTVSPLVSSTPVNLPLVFKDVKNIREFNGSFTPNNDYKYIFQNLTFEDAPTFIIIICDGHMNVTINHSNTNSKIQSVKRFSFISVVEDPLNFIQNFYLEGRTSSPSPMTQGETVNYTIFIGQGDLS